VNSKSDPKMGNVRVFIVLGLGLEGKMIISPLRRSNYHYTTPSPFYLPYSQLRPHIDFGQCHMLSSY